MRPLEAEDRRAITRLYYELNRGELLTQHQLDALAAHWDPRLLPDVKDRAERFAIARTDGSTTGVTGPRWIFHLLGLRHRAAEIGLRTESGLIVLQQRSHAKVDWPGAPDMAVAGHISQAKDDSELSYLDGAWKEIEEEIGLPRSEAGRFLVEGGLTPVGAPYCSFDSDVRRNPPFYNSEIGRIFAATITGEALGRLRFTDHEVEGVMLVTAERAWEMLSHGNIAGGMRYALPRYLDWLEQRQQLAQCHQNETENHR